MKRQIFDPYICDEHDPVPDGHYKSYNSLTKQWVIRPDWDVLTHGEKISLSKRGQNQSEHQKLAASLTQKGKKRGPQTPEHRAKIAAANKGKKFENRKPYSEEHRAKISAAKKGKKLSEEHKANISAAKKARKERKRNSKENSSID